MNTIRETLNQVNIGDLITIFNIQIAIAVFLIFLIFRGLISQLIVKIFFTITKNKKKPKDSRLYKILKVCCIFAGAYYSIMILKPNAQIEAIVNTIFKVINIIFITNIVNSFVTKDSTWFRKSINKTKNDSVNNFICKLIRGIVWIVSGYIILKELGYDLTGLVAGFGIGSVIISFAAQDTVKSLLSGLIILTDKPFDIGDFVEIGVYKGTVEDITFRSTRLKKDLDSAIVTIPNSVVTSEYVVNWNKHQLRKLEFVLNLSMNTTSEKIKDVVEKLKFMLKNDLNVESESVQVNLTEISSYSTDIRVFLYINELSYKTFLDKRQRIYCDILKLLEYENVDLAYPTQTIYVKNNELNLTQKQEQELKELIGDDDEVLAMNMLSEELAKGNKNDTDK